MIANLLQSVTTVYIGQAKPVDQKIAKIIVQFGIYVLIAILQRTNFELDLSSIV